MAGPARLFHLQEDGVLITIDPDFDHVLCVTRSFPFDPEFLPRSAPIGPAAGLDRGLERVSIHPGQHQDFIRVGILGNRGDQSIRIELGTNFMRLILLGARKGALK